MIKSVFVLLAFSVIITSCSVKEYNSSSRPIEHIIWDSLLHEHVASDGLVDYKGFIRDSVRFDKYLTLLQNNHPNKKYWSREERMAYWINAYNAFTVKMIVDHYPTKSIKDIKKGIPFVNTVWDIKFIKIEGAEYDLNNIEHGILRPKFKEPRVHFAVNCASYSCPPLRNEAYTATKLDAQLTDQAKIFLNDPRKNIIAKNQMQISKIFSWFKGDFLVKEKSIQSFINQFTDIEISNNAKISYLDYNWSLNEQKSE